MQSLETLLTIFHIFVAIVLILLVLVQSGKGGGVGAAFGGASSQIFGGRGAGSFIAKVTTGAAILFMTTSLVLSVFSSQHRSVVQQKEDQAAEAAGMGSDDTAADTASDDATAEPLRQLR